MYLVLYDKNDNDNKSDDFEKILGTITLLMEEILRHPGCKDLVNNRIDYYQLVQDFFHQQ